MKKIVWSLIFVLCAIMITGCGAESDKVLDCSKDVSSSMPSGVSATQELKVDYKNGKISTVDIFMKFELSDLYAKQIDTFINSMKSTYESQYNYDGISVITNQTGTNSFDVVISFDYQNLSSEAKTATGFVGSESYSVNKSQLSGQGYSCN